MKIDPPSTGVTRPAITCAMAMPYLMAIWCCLAILQGSRTNIPPLAVLFKTIGIVLVVVALLHAFLFVVIRKTPARELILFGLVSLFGLYGGFGVIASQYIGWSLFTAAWVILHLVAIVFAYRLGDDKRTAIFVPVATMAVGLTLCFQIFGIGMPVAGDSIHVAQLMSDLAAKDATLSEQASSTRDRPDIYYIIVDAYAGESVLKEVYGFDNRPFVTSLKKRGFFVADDSRSNYHLTELSLASSLNMTHLHELELEKFKTRIPIRKMIANSSVVRYLAQSGYQTIAFESGKSDTQCEQFDQYMAIGNALNDYQDVLYHGSLLPSLFEFTGIPHRSAARRHGDRTIETLDSIPTAVQAGSKPAFVFSHLLAPHPPFVNDELGQAVDFHGHYLLADAGHFTACYDYDLEIYRDAYRNQVAFINQKLVDMVDRIQSSDRDSIIIIQADHGPRLGLGADPLADVQPDNVDLTFREAFSILNAIYVPDDLQPEFYSSMTPVNTFRLIFNEILDTGFALEADESYYEDSYSFENVTQKSLSPKSITATAVTQNN